MLEGSVTVAKSGVYSQRHSHRIADRLCISVGCFVGIWGVVQHSFP